MPLAPHLQSRPPPACGCARLLHAGNSSRLQAGQGETSRRDGARSRLAMEVPQLQNLVLPRVLLTGCSDDLLLQKQLRRSPPPRHPSRTAPSLPEVTRRTCHRLSGAALRLRLQLSRTLAPGGSCCSACRETPPEWRPPNRASRGRR